MMIGQSLLRPTYVPSMRPGMPFQPSRPGFMPARPSFPQAAMAPRVAPRYFGPSPGWNAQLIAQRNIIQQREFNRLLRENARLSREQAALMAQQTAIQQVPNVPAPMQQTPQVSSQPSGPATDLTPAQDAAEAAAPAPEPAPHAHKSHLLLFAGLAVAAGVGGYMLIKRKKKSP